MKMTINNQDKMRMKQYFLTLILLINFLTIMAQDGDGRFDVFMDDLKEAQADATIYTSPKDRTYFVRPVLEDVWLPRAVSKTARAEWYGTTSLSPDQKKKIDQALNTLAASAAKKLMLHKPGPEKFAQGSKDEIELLKSIIPTLSDFTVHKIGLEDKNWRIEKNELDVPTGRRKWGYVWFRDNRKIIDHPYCRVYEMFIYQPYEGGGTYGESVARYERRWLCGCP
jgi:hypothetical protein